MRCPGTGLFGTDAFAATTLESVGYRYCAKQTSTATMHDSAACNVPFIGISRSGQPERHAG